MNLRLSARYDVVTTHNVDTLSRTYSWTGQYKANAYPGEGVPTLAEFKGRTFSGVANLTYHIGRQHFFTFNDTYTHYRRRTTTTLAKDVKGFGGATPLKLYFKGNKLVNVESLPNKETPDFFNRVKTTLLPKWRGMKASKAATAEVDGVTGATYSSKAVKENVKRGVKYYMKHK